jgi:hypothetical protein
MRFFSKVEMWRNCVLEKVNDEVTNQDQQRRALPAQSEALGDDFNHGCRQHEPRAQGHKVLQVRPLPMLPYYERPAKHIGDSRHHPKQQAEQEWVHGERGMIAEKKQRALSSELRAIQGFSLRSMLAAHRSQLPCAKRTNFYLPIRLQIKL